MNILKNVNLKLNAVCANVFVHTFKIYFIALILWQDQTPFLFLSRGVCIPVSAPYVFVSVVSRENNAHIESFR